MNDRELMQQALDSLEAAYHPNDEVGKVMDAIKERLAQPESECRDDGRCQYAIDHGAEGVGHCPQGKCCMPKAQPELDEDYEALANKQLASLKEAGKKTFEDAAVRALNKLYNTEPEHVHANDMSGERVHKTEKNEHEPVAWSNAPKLIYLQVCEENDCYHSFDVHDDVSWCQDKINDSDIPYIRADTSPPQREWVGLTEGELFTLWVRCPAETEDRFAFARAIEQALKEKNNG